MDTKARPKAMSPEELRDALDRAGFGQSEFARLIGYTPSAIRMYLQGMRPVPGGMALALRLLVAYVDSGAKAKALELSEMAQDDLKPPRKRKAREEATAEAA
jgi:predicted transcriptional regulator